MRTGETRKTPEPRSNGNTSVLRLLQVGLWDADSAVGNAARKGYRVAPSLMLKAIEGIGSLSPLSIRTIESFGGAFPDRSEDQPEFRRCKSEVLASCRHSFCTALHRRSTARLG